MAQESVFRLSQQLVSALTNTENNKLVFSNFYDCLLFPDRHHSSENMRLKSFQKLLSIVNQLQNVQGGAENITSVKTLIENAELLSRSSDSCAVLYFVLLLSDASRAKDEWSNGDITNSTFNNDFSIKSLCEAVKEHAHSSTSAANIFTCDVYCDWVTAFPSFFRFSQAPRKDSQKKPTKVSSQSMNEVVDRRNASFWPLYIPLASLKLQSRSDRRQTLHSMMPLLSDLSENDFARFGMPALYEPVMLMTGDFGIMHNFSVLNISRLKLIVQGLLIGVESGCIVLDQVRQMAVWQEKDFLQLSSDVISILQPVWKAGYWSAYLRKFIRSESYEHCLTYVNFGTKLEKIFMLYCKEVEEVLLPSECLLQLVCTINPYSSFIRTFHHWLNSGSWIDEYDEFPVFEHANPSVVKTNDRITWLTAYKVSKSSVPGFLYQLFDKLAFCGKAVSLLNVRIKSLANEEEAVSDEFDVQDIFRTRQTEPNTTAASFCVHDKFCFNVSTMLNEVQCQATQAVVCRQELCELFRVIQNIYFGFDSMFFASLATQMFPFFDSSVNPAAILLSVKLHLMLNAASESARIERRWRNSLSFGINFIPLEFRIESSSLFRCISLWIDIPWPINIVVTNQLLKICSEVFSFILYLHFVIWIFRKIRSFQNGNNYLRIKLRLWQLQRLLENLLAMIMNSIRTCFKQAGRMSFHESESVEQVYERHASLINSIRRLPYFWNSDYLAFVEISALYVDAVRERSSAKMTQHFKNCQRIANALFFSHHSHLNL